MLLTETTGTESPSPLRTPENAITRHPTAPVDTATINPHLYAVVDRWVSTEAIAGAVVLVARDGQVVHRQAAGFADREKRLPVISDTIFRLASLTKTIVSATALALVEQGVLALEDPVEQWLPYFTPRLADGTCPVITIRQLLTHTSGLSYDFLQAPDSPYRSRGVSEGLDRSDLSLEDNLRRLASAPLLFEPGREWRYSMSTDVLGAVIERAAGMPLAAAVAHFVTAPLGMPDTSFGVTDKARLAYPYRNGNTRALRMHPRLNTIMGGIRVSPSRVDDANAFPSGGSGMTGTAEDYLTFLEAMRTGGVPILNAESAAALGTHAIGDLRAWLEGDGWGFGLGAAVLLDAKAADTPQRSGTWQWAGVLGCHWFVDPCEKLTVVVMTNTAVTGTAGAFPEAVRDAIYGA